MYKKFAVITNLILILYFFLDITGFQIGNFILVESAWQDDLIFLLIYFLCFILFLRFDFGDYILSIWLFLWLVTQFFSHWYYTIFGASVDKLNSYHEYFKNTFQVFSENSRVIVPDLYHIVLHVLILISFMSVVIYHFKKNSSSYKKA